MNAILKLVQGSPAWHAHRAQYRNASESAAVMGASPWLTPYQFWLVRTGRVEQAVTAPMRHGTEMEPRARAVYEAQTGLVMQPLVLADGDYSASLDGITLEGDLLLEVKCPYKGQSSALWQAVSAGEVPEYYSIQIQHSSSSQEPLSPTCGCSMARRACCWRLIVTKLSWPVSGQPGTTSSNTWTTTRHHP